MPKHKFLIYSTEGWGWNIAPLLQEMGHEAVVYIADPEIKHIGDGLCDKVDDWREIAAKDRYREWIFVWDSIKHGEIADYLRAEGWRVWGGGRFADRLEKDREFGRKFCERAGLKTPPTETFPNAQAALEFVRENPGRYVLKPHDNKIAVYVSYGHEDAIEMLEYWSRLTGLENTEIDVQKYIEGRNIDVEVWWHNGNLIGPPNYDIETKFFYPDDMGPIVGCMTSVVWWSKQPSRTWDLVRQIQPLMKRIKWTGPISCNIIVEESTHQLYVLEWTPRFGYNAYYCLWELYPDWGELFVRTFEVEDDEVVWDDINTHQFAVAAEVSIAPYPFESPDKELMRQVYSKLEGMPIFLEDNYPAKVYPCDVYKHPSGQLVCAGVNGIIAEVVAVDETPEAAWEKVVATVKALKIPTKQARIADGIKDFQIWFPKFKEWKIVGDIEPIYEPAIKGVQREEEEPQGHRLLIPRLILG